jgi:hypothetical protein
MAIWSILWLFWKILLAFGIFCGTFFMFWYEEISGNPQAGLHKVLDQYKHVCNEWVVMSTQMKKMHGKDTIGKCLVNTDNGQGPILRRINLQLQLQHCSKLERFFKVE